MIAASDPQEFVPSGRQQALRHPGPVEVATNRGTAADDFLLDRFEKVSLSEVNRTERWMLRKSPNYASENSQVEQKELISDVNSSKYLRYSNEGNSFKSETNYSLNAAKSLSLGQINKKNEKLHSKLDIDYMEEELYIKGNVVIWSKGLVCNSDQFDYAHETICSYTSQFPIKHALWCTFHCERPGYNVGLANNKVYEFPAKTLPSVCIIDSKTVRVFTINNEDFIASVPFQVRQVWNIKFGILLEKEYAEDKGACINDGATLFSITHPLEDVCPVVMKHNGVVQLVDSCNLQLVFTNENPSIALVYNTNTCQHSLYGIRRVKCEEWPENCEDEPNVTPMVSSIASKLRSHSSLWDYQKITSQSAASYNSIHQSRSASSMATISRCQSPAVSPLISDTSSLRPSKNLSLLRNTNNSASLRQESSQIDQTNCYHHINPTLCLEHIWTDNLNLVQESINSDPASKAFLSDDMSGQWFLCYLVPTRQQLSIVRIDFSNPIVCGRVSSITAKDAVPIPHLHMLAILEYNRNIILHSGMNVVGKLHIGGVLTQHIPSPYVRRNTSQFNSPFPKRSSLLPTCGTPNLEPRFDEHLLSPVLPSISNANVLHTPESCTLNNVGTLLNGLKDAIEDRITLQYLDGTYYRVKLPPLTSVPVIESCLNALRQTLPRDAALILLTRWYTVRNSPGPCDVSVEQEWKLFTTLLLDLLGYGIDGSNETPTAEPMTPLTAPKRQRQSSSGVDIDWTLLQNSKIHKDTGKHLEEILNINPITSEVSETKPSGDIRVNTSAVLFNYIKIIHYTLHLLYEELKLNVLRSEDLPLIARFLNRLAADMNMKEYVVHYWKDFPELCDTNKIPAIPQNELKSVINWNIIRDMPDDVMQHIYNMFKGSNVTPYPYINNVNSRCKNIIQLCGVLIRGSKDPTCIVHLNTLVNTILPPSNKCNPYSTPKDKCIAINQPIAERIVVLMTELGITTRDLDTFPPGINLLMHDLLWKCRENPPSNWTSEAYNLLWRSDLAAQAQIIEKTKSEGVINKQNIGNYNQLAEILPAIKQVDVEEDGMVETENPVLRLRFCEDQRVAEARRLLQSSKPVPITIKQRPDISDHDFIEEQEKHLYAICTRTMALPVGRGMFTLRTVTPVITEPLPGPQLCLTGKAPPMGTTVELTHIDIPANMNLWPLFHNGVANGLRITQDANNIDSTWIIFNKPRTNETHMEHAGFLMALGLNGHLKNLDVLSTYDYLVKLQEMTSVGILLGLSSAFRGTCHSGLTKMLSIHIETLLPPTSMELDVPQNLQVAALLGIGLVYQGTSHRHMTEVLLTEIGRPPGPEMENSVDRESYSLAAGLALGLVTLKQGGRQSGLSDLNVPDTLHYYMIGGNRRPLMGSQRDKYKVPSFQIREGTSVNLDVTSPGATLALGLMYLNSGNKAVADWMAPPETQYLLDFIKPDFLMLRIIARSLIMWDDVKSTKEWIESQIPNTIKPFCMVKPSSVLDIDYEAMNQAYCNIIAGACFAVGLKYAGSADETAFRTLLHYSHMFTSLTGKSIAELAGKPTIETCLNVVLLSVSVVMAGTGNLEIMRLIRHLRRRIGVASTSVVTYGSHLAIHMALGLLFLGGGRYTLSNSPDSVAALICAFYPKFPTHSNDNRYHLQAFRHLYVLAIEARLIIPKDISLGRMCYCNVKVTRLDGAQFNIKCPGLIPDLNTLAKVKIEDERYWPVIFERGRNWEQLLNILKSFGYIEVKQRAGCLSYLEDKLGFHSQLARTLTQSETVPWDPPSKAIVSFTSDCTIRYFCDHYLGTNTASYDERETRLQQILTKATYDCVIKDKIVVLPIFASFVKLIQNLQTRPSVIQLWQFKIACTQILNNSFTTHLMSSETMLAFQQQIINIINEWKPLLQDSLKAYVLNGDICISQEFCSKLAVYITLNDIPFNRNFQNEELLYVLSELQLHNYGAESVNILLKILGITV